MNQGLAQKNNMGGQPQHPGPTSVGLFIFDLTITCNILSLRQQSFLNSHSQQAPTPSPQARLLTDDRRTASGRPSMPYWPPRTTPAWSRAGLFLLV